MLVILINFQIILFLILNLNLLIILSIIIKKNYKFDLFIQNFIIENINNKNCLTATDISNLIENKFEIKISLTTIYSFLKKNNYVYKKTVININP